MNKIYSEPIQKTQSLIEGVKKQQSILAGKGIDIDIAKLDAACNALLHAGEEQEIADMKLKAAREAAHNCLDELKRLFCDAKTPIKQNFAQEQWITFGVADKK